MKTIRIQIVEDDADYRYLMERTLEKEPRFELCSSCEDSETALSAALNENPDIVLMDLNLSGKDQREDRHRLRQGRRRDRQARI